jgi:hypothetical protein
MKASTNTLRRTRRFGLALAVAAALAPGASAASNDYAIESFRVQGKAAGGYDAIEAHRTRSSREPSPASDRSYDAIELVRAPAREALTPLPYDGSAVLVARKGAGVAPS